MRNAAAQGSKPPAGSASIWDASPTYVTVRPEVPPAAERRPRKALVVPLLRPIVSVP